MANRRQFVTVGAGACLASVLPGCVTIGVYQGTVVKDRIPVEKLKFTELAGSKGTIFVETFELDAPIVLTQKPDGTYFAVSARCTHQACIVRPGSNFINCSCHGSMFEHSGAVVRGPAEKPLPSYPVEVKDDEIVIVIP